MTESKLEAVRLDLVELIDKVEKQVDDIHAIYAELHQEGNEAVPIQWLDFRIVLDRWIVSSTMLYDKLISLRD